MPLHEWLRAAVMLELQSVALSDDNGSLVFFGNNQLVALAVDIDNLNLVVVLQVLAQFGDVDIHGACIEVVVVNPDGAQCVVALENFVGV